MCVCFSRARHEGWLCGSASAVCARCGTSSSSSSSSWCCPSRWPSTWADACRGCTPHASSTSTWTATSTSTAVCSSLMAGTRWGPGGGGRPGGEADWESRFRRNTELWSRGWLRLVSFLNVNVDQGLQTVMLMLIRDYTL